MDESNLNLENAESAAAEAVTEAVDTIEAAEEAAETVGEAVDSAVEAVDAAVDSAVEAVDEAVDAAVDNEADKEVIVEKIDPFQEPVHFSSVDEPTLEMPRVEAEINEVYEAPDTYFGEGTAADVVPMAEETAEPEFQAEPEETPSAASEPAYEAPDTEQQTYEAPQTEQQTYETPKAHYSPTESPWEKKTREPKYVTRKAFIITLILAMIFSGLVGAAGYALANSIFGGTTIDKSINTTNYNLARSTGSVLSLQEIIARNENSVVAILTEQVSTDYWMGQYVTKGAGSGVIYKEDGYIITNNHVIEGASTITVTLHDGTEYPATLVATDELTDIAVIKIDATGLTPVTFGDMDKVSVGDAVIAIGNPLGTLSGTATEGIVSALEREITVDNKAMSLIQTSASINPGNSGGGLFDQYGNLIGIVVAKSSGSDVEGLGFAIPVDKVESVAKSLVENGYVEGRPMAGITIIDLTDPSEAMKYGVSITGVYIGSVNGEKAKAAGLKSGDLIYYLDDDKITSSSQLVSLIQSHQVGDVVTFTVVRNNEILKCDVELVESTPELQQASNQLGEGEDNEGESNDGGSSEQPGNNGGESDGGSWFDWFFGGGN